MLCVFKLDAMHAAQLKEARAPLRLGKLVRLGLVEPGEAIRVGAVALLPPFVTVTHPTPP